MHSSKTIALTVASLSVALFGVFPNSATAYTTDGLVLNFDATNPDSLNPLDLGTWFDISPTAVEATLFGTTRYSNTRDAVVFDGSGAYYDVDGDFRDFSSGMTLEFGASFGENPDHFERIFDFGMGAETNGIIVGREATTENVFLETWDNGVRLGRCVTTTDPLESDSYHQWYFVLDDDLSCRIYRDDVLQDTFISWASDYRYFDALPPIEERTQNYIARSAWAGDAAFEGYISYIRIYTDDLTDDEIAENLDSPERSAENLAPTGATIELWALVAAIVLGAIGAKVRRDKRTSGSS